MCECVCACVLETRQEIEARGEENMNARTQRGTLEGV